MKLNKLSNSNLYGVDISDEFIEQSINNFKTTSEEIDLQYNLKIKYISFDKNQFENFEDEIKDIENIYATSAGALLLTVILLIKDWPKIDNFVINISGNFDE